METHETTLWTDRYIDEKYGEERTASFKYFKQFIRMPSPRTLVSFHEQLSKQMSKDGRKRIPSLDTINEYSCKWKWMERSKAYDDYQQQKHDEEHDEQDAEVHEADQLERGQDEQGEGVKPSLLLCSLAGGLRALRALRLRAASVRLD